MNKKAANTLKYLFFLALAIVLMYFAFRAISFTDFVEGLKSANYWLVSASILAGIAAYILRALRWKILIDSLGYNISAKNVYHATMIGYLANFTIPRIGEIIRCTALKKTDNIAFEKSFGTVIVERCYDLLFLLLFLFLVIAIRFEVFGVFISEKIYHPAIEKISNMSIYAFIGIFIFAVAIIFLFFHIRKKIKKNITGLISGLKTGIKMKSRKIFFLYTILIYLCYWMTGFLILKAIPTTASLDIVDALFLFVIGAFGWVIPAQGGFGSYHILVALGLGVFGISYSDGIIVATISHESQVIFMILLGLASLVTVFVFSKKQNKKI
jgi:conserved hypothetical protein